MNIEFNLPSLKDKEFIQEQFDKYQSRSCDHCFTNVYLWAPHYGTTFAKYKDTLIFQNEINGHPAYSMPIGETEKVKEVLGDLLEDSKEKGYPLTIFNVSPTQFEYLNSIYPNLFDIVYDDGDADYVYEREKLATLSGKKLHGKRNHINKFLATYDDWSFEEINSSNLCECIEMAMKWRTLNECDSNEEKSAEMCVTLRALNLMSELGTVGGMLRVNGEVVAITIGQQTSDDTFDVQIEKAYASIDGAYPMINQQFVKNMIPENVLYVNREEDMGEEGLRKAKLSYRPVFMVEKGIAVFKE